MSAPSISAAAWYHQLWTRARCACYDQPLQAIAPAMGLSRNTLGAWLAGTYHAVTWETLQRIEAWVEAWEQAHGV